MTDGLTPAQKAVLERLDFDGQIRCEHRTASGEPCVTDGVRTPATLAMRCLHCTQVPNVLCADHARQSINAVRFGGLMAWCSSCRHTSAFFGTLFRVEGLA